MPDVNSEYKFFDDPLQYFHAMLEDISRAKKYIYIETYRFNNDSIGIKFRDSLTRKSKQGVKIRLLMDSWGTFLPGNFFIELIKSGGEVRYFRKIRFIWNFFSKNHQRNHRKLMVIDDKISYIGSGNLTDYSLNWKESMLRIVSDLTVPLKKVFLQDFKFYNKYVFEKITHIRKITHGSMQIIRDVPSLRKQRIRKKFFEMFRRANKEVIIETPYFLPGYMFRKSLTDLVKRGINVKVLIPKNSDVGLVDILRSRYLGNLHKAGIKIYFYLPHNLHAR